MTRSRPGPATASRVVRIGTAGWTLPRQFKDEFANGTSVLARYATRFNAVEINSTFYRPHKPVTFARWAETVPEDFRFAVKLPKAITHERRLADTAALMMRFIDEIRYLGPKLGPVLMQFPPSFAFDATAATAFFQDVRARLDGPLVCEPRHPSWFSHEAERLVSDLRIARVAADPACVPLAAMPGADRGLSYSRLHGSPRMYWSPYQPTFIDALAMRLAADPAAERWCIFDNTASGAATGDALALKRQLHPPSSR
jgi:uncharacterized protein YecE (DUF72 family)